MSIVETPVERALIDYIECSPIALTLSRAGAADFALIAANAAFCALTLYEPEAIIGKNCRFLQGAHVEQDVKARMRAYLTDETQNNFRGLIVNVRADGKPFLNLLFLAKLREKTGVCSHVLGSQFDASRTHLQVLADYDRELAKVFADVRPSLSDDSVMAGGTYEALAGAAGAIARAKILLAEL